jgi:hypothetical protein
MRTLERVAWLQTTAATQWALRLSWALAVLGCVAAAAGLARPALYHDNALVTAGWFGNDAVTLVVAMPLLAFACRGAERGSLAWTLVWLGALDYVVYNFLFYLFGAALNALFLVYEALVVGGVAALILGLAALNVPAVDVTRITRPAWRGSALVTGVLAVGLGGLWIGQSLAFVLTGALPAVVVETGHPTNVAGALDLALVVSVMGVAAVLLWRRRPWGVVLAVMSHVKGVVYMTALAAASASAVAAGFADVAAQIPVWVAIGAFEAAVIVALLGPLTH